LTKHSTVYIVPDNSSSRTTLTMVDIMEITFIGQTEDKYVFEFRKRIYGSEDKVEIAEILKTASVFEYIELYDIMLDKLDQK
jgi:hypothetical protein